MRIKAFNHLSDEEIVRLVVSEGDSELYAILFERYHKRVVEKCHTLAKNRELAEELAEDILSKAYEKLESFKGNSSFGSWLYSITYNHCIDFLRLKKRLHYPEWNSQNEIPEIIDEMEEDNTELHSGRLQDLLNLLHTEERAMLLMKYQDNLSLKQIADALRLTEGAVKMRMKRSKARLLYLYKSRYGNYN